MRAAGASSGSPARPGTTTNDGNLCVKGRFAYRLHRSPGSDRPTPLVRGADGELHAPPAGRRRCAAPPRACWASKQRHGADALGFVSSSRCTMEENYLVQKLARAVFGTNNVHQCAAT